MGVDGGHIMECDILMSSKLEFRSLFLLLSQLCVPPSFLSVFTTTSPIIVFFSFPANNIQDSRRQRCCVCI